MNDEELIRLTALLARLEARRDSDPLPSFERDERANDGSGWLRATDSKGVLLWEEHLSAELASKLADHGLWELLVSDLRGDWTETDDFPA
jgi:hypothetical protein